MILEGTTSTGAVVPVQVTTDGKVVAEGMTGPEGPQGPEGPEGPKGDQGDPGSPGNLWSGSDPGPISYTGGSVGIGSANPNTYANYTTLTLDGTNGSILDLEAGGTICGELQVLSNEFRINAVGASGQLKFYAGASQRVTIDSSGRLLIGTISMSVDSALVVAGNMGANLSPAIQWLARRQNAGSIAADADIGFLRFGSQDGGLGAEIVAEADAAWGADDHPTRIVFSTCASGSSSPTARMTIFSDGAVAIEEKLVLKSPDGSRWAVEVDNSGNLSTSQIV